MTPEDTVAPWTANTLDYAHVQRRLRELDVGIRTGTRLEAIEAGGVGAACVHTGRTQRIAGGSVVLVTSRLPCDELHHSLLAREAEWRATGIESVTCIGDCLAPGLIAHAVYAGHRFARELGEPPAGGVPFRRVRPEILRRDSQSG